MIPAPGAARPGRGLDPADLLAQVRKLRDITEQAVLAARTLKGEDLTALNAQRADALFELRVLIGDGVPEHAVTDDLRGEVRALSRAEQRLAAVANTVVSAFGLESAPRLTYGRSGRVGG